MIVGTLDSTDIRLHVKLQTQAVCN